MTGPAAETPAPPMPAAMCTFSDRIKRVLPLRLAPVLLGTVTCVTLVAIHAGCQSGLEKIDRQLDALIDESTDNLGGEALRPAVHREVAQTSRPDRSRNIHAERLPTTNPAASEVTFTPRAEAVSLADRLQILPDAPSDDAIRLDLPSALQLAMSNSREYRFAEEEYVLAALRLLIERHRWGPRFFNDVSAQIFSGGDDGFFDTSISILNEFGVTQRLPYGGEVSARFLAQAAEDLHARVSSPGTQSADLIFSGNVPLLRGAGQIAREDRIQAERDLIYAARQFERFRRIFFFNISDQFLDLIVLARNIENAERGVESLERLERRARAFVETGRETPIDLARARQDTLFARDRLNRQRESYRLAIDRFKIRLGLHPDDELIIVSDEIDLPTPEVTIDEAVYAAMSYRLDLQTRRDQLDDAQRLLRNARNNLLPDLNLGGSVLIPTTDSKDRAGLDFSAGDTSFEVGVTFGLPLDREIERITVRQAQINLERSVRAYDEFRDNIAIEVRSAVRNIERALFSLQIQDENVRVAETNQEAIEAAPDRATARDRSEAVDNLLRALDERDAARRDLQVAVLNYLLETGQLRVSPDGTIELLDGMQFARNRLREAGSTE